MSLVVSLLAREVFAVSAGREPLDQADPPPPPMPGVRVGFQPNPTPHRSIP